MDRCKSADDYYEQAPHWQPELQTLRHIVLKSGLVEEVKWGGPCYTCNGKNVVGVGGFKSYFGLWFHQGALLDDPDKVLINAQEGKTRALRQWRMTAAYQIKPRVIARYLRQAKTLAEEGRAIKPQRQTRLSVPAELRQALRADSATSEAFEALRPGQKREYAQYVAEAKRADTRQRRIEKILPLIAAGGGLNDRYRKS